MNSQLHDFPIEPARLAPAASVLPDRGAHPAGVDAELLAGARAEFGHERTGRADAHRLSNPIRSQPGTAALPSGLPRPGVPADASNGASQRPRIVATRFDAARLRRTREELHYSQEDFAAAIRAAGKRLGEPNGCTKRNVQKWESGEIKMPRASVQRALEVVTHQPFGMLCTPVPPPDPDEATIELSAIATDMNNLVQRMTKLYAYLSR